MTTHPTIYDIILTFQKYYQELPNNADSEMKPIVNVHHYKKI